MLLGGDPRCWPLSAVVVFGRHLLMLPLNAGDRCVWWCSCFFVVGRACCFCCCCCRIWCCCLFFRASPLYQVVPLLMGCHSLLLTIVDGLAVVAGVVGSPCGFWCVVSVVQTCKAGWLFSMYILFLDVPCMRRDPIGCVACLGPHFFFLSEHNTYFCVGAHPHRIICFG